MGLMDKMMTSMIPEMIGKTFASYKPEEMEKVVDEMMDAAFSRLDNEKMSSIMHDMMPAVIESFFARISKEQREDILALYRGVLDRMEEKYSA